MHHITSAAATATARRPFNKANTHHQMILTQNRSAGLAADSTYCRFEGDSWLPSTQNDHAISARPICTLYILQRARAITLALEHKIGMHVQLRWSMVDGVSTAAHAAHSAQSATMFIANIAHGPFDWKHRTEKRFMRYFLPLLFSIIRGAWSPIELMHDATLDKLQQFSCTHE